MTLRELYVELCGQIESRFEAGQLFSHVTDIQTHELPHIGGGEAGEEPVRRLRRLAAKRREGVPLQYLLGEWEFYGLPFRVGPGVLIPRADTETLVETALELLSGHQKPEILDLCSGSGCIAIALAHALPDAAVTALEISLEAIRYLRENVVINESRVEVAEADLRDYTHPRPLDLLTANPPYIPEGELAALSPEVRREPHKALDGGRDGLDFYRVIAARYRDMLKLDGMICFEVGINQAGAVAEILAQNGYTGIGTRRDVGGIERVVFASRG